MNAEPPLYAGFWRRLAAFLSDVLLFLFPWFYFYSVLLREERSLAGLFGATLVLAWIYNAGFHVSPLQATLGKAMYGIKVTDLQGERLRFDRASLRFLAAWLSALPLMSGFLLIGHSPLRQALHDRIAGTLVVRLHASPADVRKGGGPMDDSREVGFTFAAAFALLFVAVGAAVAIPAYHGMAIRSKVTSAIFDAHTAKADVEMRIAEGRLPAPGAPQPLPIVSPYGASLQVDHSGRISLALKGLVPSANGRVYMSPRAGKNGTIEWKCTSEGVKIGFLPATCRP